MENPEVCRQDYPIAEGSEVATARLPNQGHWVDHDQDSAWNSRDIYPENAITTFPGPLEESLPTNERFLQEIHKTIWKWFQATPKSRKWRLRKHDVAH